MRSFAAGTEEEVGVVAAAAEAERAPAGREPPARIRIGEEQYEYYYTCLT